MGWKIKRYIFLLLVLLVKQTSTKMNFERVLTSGLSVATSLESPVTLAFALWDFVDTLQSELNTEENRSSDPAVIAQEVSNELRTMNSKLDEISIQISDLKGQVFEKIDDKFKNFGLTSKLKDLFKNTMEIDNYFKAFTEIKDPTIEQVPRIKENVVDNILTPTSHGVQSILHEIYELLTNEFSEKSLLMLLADDSMVIYFTYFRK